MAKKDEETLPIPAGWEDDYQLAFPSEYLGAQHLRGTEPTLIISRVRLPELEMVQPGMRPKKSRRMVIEFDGLKGRADGTPHKWIVNKTNAATIKLLYGKAPRNWAGKRITLWGDPDVDDPKSPKDPQTGKRQKCTAIRVRPRIPADTSQQRARGAGSPPPPDGAEPAPAAGGGPMSEEELAEIARREAEEDGR